MDFSLLYQLRKKSSWMDFIFYFFSALLISVVFFYFVFAFKVYLQNKKVSEIDSKIALFGTDQQKKYENEVFGYKKKIDDFTVVINNHKIYSNIFVFIEKKTLPNVWFSNFNISESAKDIKLSGETDSMESLSRQIRVFEESRDYVESIDVSNLQSDSTGKVRFSLGLSLESKVFEHKSITGNP